jgi:hypothetical protein
MAPGPAEIFILFFFLAIMAVSLLSVAVWVWGLIDCLTNEPSGDDQKVIWVVVILLAGMIGAILYLLIRRPDRIRKYGR